MKKLRKFLEGVLKVLLVIFTAMIIAVMKLFKSKTGIICLEIILVVSLVIYSINLIFNKKKKDGKYLPKRRLTGWEQWFEVIWEGGVLGLDIVLIEQILSKIAN